MSHPVNRAGDAALRKVKRIKNNLAALRTSGWRTMLTRAAAGNISYEVDDLLGDKPLFRYATCNDLISLMGLYPQYCREDRDSPRSTVWGLKSMGTLFCVDRIVRFQPARVLELGAGWNRHFDDHFGSRLEYWMMDDASDIGWSQRSLERFDEAQAQRRNTHFVRGYLGGFSTELPDAAFDLVFSISVVEHVPPEHKPAFYQDMFRILKPGGWMAHSIDMFDEALNRAEFDLLRRTGFKLPARPDLSVRVHASQGNPTLFEDMWTVFHGYLGLKRPDKWENLKKVSGHNATLLVFGQKPA